MKKAVFFILIIVLAIVAYRYQKNYQETQTTTPPVETGAVRTGLTETGIINEDVFSGTAPVIQGPLHLKAVGTEPFWGFDFSGGLLSMMDANNLSNTGALITVDYTGIVLISQTGNTAQYANSGSVVLNIVYTNCSDGMSDVVYTGSVVATISGTVYTGCVNDF